ncbi:hypothetical protein Nepgr_033431 [Nepenthes gracilis]|uniref:Kinesin-like protein n=1 Tax=Nepenthes gracilis TaxID=150966 RepID=A0AAD3Y6K6_NEPGR|nr:hypothetical protein Nepgr_033431 [Nepenthes gracilis]
MPVSTRSQILNNQDENGSNISVQSERQQTQIPHALRNPHCGLKEKLKSLALLYEQQKLASMASKNNQPSKRPEEGQQSPTNSAIDQLDPTPNMEKPPAIRENPMQNSTLTKTNVIPQPADDLKENLIAENGRFVGFSCPPPKRAVTTAMARRLSLGKRRESLGETKQSSISNNGNKIMVFLRLRPMVRREKDAGGRCCVRIVNRRDVYLTDFALEHDYLRLKRLHDRHFTFDASFSESASQQDVYSTTTAELVEAVLEGRNGSVFCYGATGAGKTYTMLGTLENPGVMVLAIKDLFTKIRQRSFDGNHVVQLSYLEVYNETVRDLLSPGRPLVLREDKQGIVAAGLTQYRAYSTDEVMALLIQGNKNRTTEPTRVNETSSRSHAILQVVVEYRMRDAASMSVVSRVGKLSLIDLAGSERALATDQRSVRSIEGANINRSLLALSSCINALVEGKKHIPYRNSKLTQLLKDSLGGACNTVMIANISPCNLFFGETQNTLHWANRAKEIRNKACEVNEEIVRVPESETDQAKLLLELQKENRELRVQLAKQQQKLLILQAQSLAANSSPGPSSVSSLLSPLPPPPSSKKANKKHKSKSSSLLGMNCYTPELRKKETHEEESIRVLQKTVKEMEAEIERMKKDHELQLKQKDQVIHGLLQKAGKGGLGNGGGSGQGVKMMVTRASLKPKESNNGVGELRSPGRRFLSPEPGAKKRTFWDITAANSPSITTLNDRKTRSHLTTTEAAGPPSLLLQPGFSRQRFSPLKKQGDFQAQR